MKRNLLQKAQDLYENGGKQFSKLLVINNIPTVITNNHNENFYYWQLISHATTLHIDAHPDMGDWIPCRKDKKTYHQELSICNFLSAGVHYNHIYEIYWLNPHSRKRRLHDVG